MPLFGFRKDKKHEQSHIQAQAVMTKNAASSGKRGAAKKGTRKVTSAKPEKISGAVVTKDAGAAKLAVAIPSGAFTSVTDAIIRPRITEKSGLLSQGGVYTFEVGKDATKASVAKAIATLYKVTPVKIAVINLPAKKVFVRGRRGTVSGIRKAMVTVKKGDKIDFV